MKSLFKKEVLRGYIGRYLNVKNKVGDTIGDTVGDTFFCTLDIVFEKLGIPFQDFFLRVEI